MYDPQRESRSRLIEMVADGDLCLVEITVNGPRFEYTNKGLKKPLGGSRRDRTHSTVQGIIVIVLVLAILSAITLMVV